MNHLMLFEDFKLKPSNIYSQLGQNITNYNNVLRSKLMSSKFNDPNIVKKIDEMSNLKNSKIVKISDVNSVIKQIFDTLIAKLNTSKDGDFRALHALHYNFITYFLTKMKFDLNKLSKSALNRESFRIYKLSSLTDLKQQASWIDKRFEKLNNDKIATLMKNDINEDYKNISSLFKNEKSLLNRDLTQYTIKPDEQQKEAENGINNFVSKISNEQLDKIKQLDQKEVVKIQNLKEIPNLNQDFLKRFDQPGLVDSHRFMKPWFLAAFQNAEKNFGKPFYVTSGIRTEEYQKYLTSLGYQTAKKNSPHIEGVAADISIVNLDVNKVLSAFEKAGFTRFGVGKSFIHVDLGDQLNSKIWIPYSKWTYNY